MTHAEIEALKKRSEEEKGGGSQCGRESGQDGGRTLQVLTSVTLY